MKKEENLLKIAGIGAALVVVGYGLHLKDKNKTVIRDSKPKETLILGTFIGISITSIWYFLAKHQ